MTSDLPIEVVTMILSNLCQTDLLRCRLVNHSWNRESLVVFRKSKFRTHLNIGQTGGNANKYIEFASTQNPQLVLSIHLTLEGFPLRHPKTVETVTSLQRLCGPDSIQSFTLDTGCHLEDELKIVMILLSKISHALKILDVKYYSVSCTEVLLLDLMKDLSFPNVKSLNYLFRYPTALTLVKAQFIHKCPNLKKLYLESESPDVTFPPTLQKLVVRNVSDPILLRNNIIKCSRLHTLKIYNYESEDRQIIASILEGLEKTLKSLTIGVDPLFRFPRLPYSESLMLKDFISTIVALNLHAMNINSETFPSLKLVCLPFIFSLHEGPPLPSVKTLVILVLAYDRSPYTKSTVSSLQEYFKDLEKIFPNATTVSLKEEIPNKELLNIGIQNKSQCKTVLKELITSELATQIHQIQIDGVRRDILGETLEQNKIPPQIMMTFSGPRNYEAEALIQQVFGFWTGEFGIKGIQCNDEGAGPSGRVVFTEGCQSGHKMTNIKKVKLVFRSNEDTGKEVADLQLNLMSIAKSLPSLMEIELIGVERELHSKQFDNLAVEYPNLLLKITKLGPKKQYGEQ